MGIRDPQFPNFDLPISISALTDEGADVVAGIIELHCDGESGVGRNVEGMT